MHKAVSINVKSVVPALQYFGTIMQYANITALAPIIQGSFTLTIWPKFAEAITRSRLTPAVATLET